MSCWRRPVACGFLNESRLTNSCRCPPASCSSNATVSARWPCAASGLVEGLELLTGCGEYWTRVFQVQVRGTLGEHLDAEVDAGAERDIVEARGGEVIAAELVAVAADMGAIVFWNCAVEECLPDPASKSTVDQFDGEAQPLANVYVAERAVLEPRVAARNYGQAGSIEAAVTVQRGPCPDPNPTDSSLTPSNRQRSNVEPIEVNRTRPFPPRSASRSR